MAMRPHILWAAVEAAGAEVVEEAAALRPSR
jgi:hypothetical protein